MKTLLGVDIGTQGTKAAMFDEWGKVLATSFVRSRLYQPAPGITEEDPEAQYASVCQAIAKCVRSSGIRNVAGIGVAGQMAGVIGIGRNGRAVTPYDSWLDTRCASQIPKIVRASGDEVLRKTGCSPGLNHGPKMLWWNHARPRKYRNIRAFVQPGAYAAMRMCGLSAEQAFIDKTYLHFSGFADNARASWDASLCRTLGMDVAKLPTIVDPESIVGQLSVEAAKACGLRVDVPVVAGCGDTAASFLSCGVVREGIAVDVAGTASVYAATVNAFKPDVRNRMLACGRSAVPGLWHSYAYINGGGMNLEWFLREIGGHSFELLERRAEALSDEDLPYFIPHFGGRACPAQPHLRGGWVGLDWTHTRAHLFRAMLTSVAMEYAAYQSVVKTLYPRLRTTELRVTGGGARSRLWNQLKADALGVAVRSVKDSVGAPAGVAMLAGWGVGIFRELPAIAKRWVKTGAPLKPRSRNRGRHRQAIYEQLLQTLGSVTPEMEP